MNTSAAFEPFLSFCQAERHVASSTLAKYRDCFESWIRPSFGTVEVAEISRLGVLERRQAMVDRHLSIARQYSVIMFLKSFLKFCRTTLGLPCLDCAEIKLPNFWGCDEGNTLARDDSREYAKTTCILEPSHYDL